MIYGAMFDAPQDEPARAWLAGCARGDVREHPQLAGNIMHDLHTVALMREHGVCDIHTADKDFLQFRDLRVLNPLAA